jgi:hypothetical protein
VLGIFYNAILFSLWKSLVNASSAPGSNMGNRPAIGISETLQDRLCSFQISITDLRVTILVTNGPLPNSELCI